MEAIAAWPSRKGSNATCVGSTWEWAKNTIHSRADSASVKSLQYLRNGCARPRLWDTVFISHRIGLLFTRERTITIRSRMFSRFQMKTLWKWNEANAMSCKRLNPVPNQYGTSLSTLRGFYLPGALRRMRSRCRKQTVKPLLWIAKRCRVNRILIRYEMNTVLCK